MRNALTPWTAHSSAAIPCAWLEPAVKDAIPFWDSSAQAMRAYFVVCLGKNLSSPQKARQELFPNQPAWSD